MLVISQKNNKYPYIHRENQLQAYLIMLQPIFSFSPYQTFNYCRSPACYSIIPQVFLLVLQVPILHSASSCLYLPSTTAVYVFLDFFQGEAFAYQMVNIIRGVSVILCNRLDILKVIVLCVSTLHII